MSVVFKKESNNLYLISIKGIFTFNDQKKFENWARAEIDPSCKIRALILAEQFSGWGKEGDWGDLTFMYEYDPYIEKIAVVVDEKWRDELLMYLGAGRRQAPVKSFSPDEEKDARKWLQGESE